MRIKTVRVNNRRKALQVETRKGTLLFPYAKLETPPSFDDPIVEVFVDSEIGDEGFTCRLKSGAENTVVGSASVSDWTAAGPGSAPVTTSHGFRIKGTGQNEKQRIQITDASDGDYKLYFPPNIPATQTTAIVWNVPWIAIGGDGPSHLFLGAAIDHLTIGMMVMVTLISTLVHIYSIGYMKGDKRFERFFAYLALVGLMPSIRRVFGYHAAEHMAVHTNEHALDLEPENLRRFPAAHPRCGTASD